MNCLRFQKKFHLLLEISLDLRPLINIVFILKNYKKEVCINLHTCVLILDSCVYICAFEGVFYHLAILLKLTCQKGTGV